MSQTYDHYFIERFVEPFTLPARQLYALVPGLYAHDRPEHAIVDMTVSGESCVSFCILDDAQAFYLYYPHDPEGERCRRIDPALIVEGGHEPLAYADGARGLFAYAQRTLAVAYEEELRLFTLESDDVVSVALKAGRIAAGEGRFYVALAGEQRIVVCDTGGTLLDAEEVAFTGELLDMHYRGGSVHLLTRRDGVLHVDEAPAPHAAGASLLALPGGGGFVTGSSAELPGLRFSDAAELEPLPLYKMASLRLGCDCRGDLWALDAETGKIRRFVNAPYYDASVTHTRIFDSFKEGTQWHRLLIDRELPEGTSIIVEVVAGGKTERFTDAPDLLLYGMAAAELEVRLTLYSDSTRRRSPRLHALRSLFDVTPYTEYLPACYRGKQDVEVEGSLEKRDSDETLTRYLAIFQSVLGILEEQIGKSPGMLSPARADAAFLGWLSGWLGTARDYRWPEARWRAFLQRAYGLYRALGTKGAMEEVLGLYCDYAFTIDEFESDTFRSRPFEFCVRVDAEQLKDPVEIEVIESIIRTFKPAHTRGRLNVKTAPDFVVGESVLATHLNIK